MELFNPNGYLAMQFKLIRQYRCSKEEEGKEDDQ
jgi:hypothetical protein